jgi:hypothetical protein
MYLQKNLIVACAGHSGCKSCLKDCIAARGMCPICRSTVPRNYQASVTVALRNAIDRIFIHDSDYQQRKEEAHRPPATISAPATSTVAAYSDAMHDAAAEDFESARIILDQVYYDEEREQLQSGLPPEWLRCFVPVEAESALHLSPASALDESVAVGTMPHTDVIFAEMSRISRKSGIYAETPGFLESCAKSMQDHIKNMMSEIGYHHPSRLAHTVNSVQAALKPHHTVVYGKGGAKGVRYILSPYIAGVLRQVHPTMHLTSEGLSTIHDLNVDIIDRVVSMAVHCVTSGGNPPVVAGQGLSDTDYSSRVPIPVTHASSRGMVPDRPDICVVMAGPESLAELAFPHDGCPNVGMTGEVLPAAAIMAGANGIVIAELLKHATSECTKALTKLFVSAFDVERLMRHHIVDDLRTMSGLQFCPVHVALIASHLHNVALTPQAAVVLATIAEYLTAEILELSGNAARDHKSLLIGPHHIDMAIRYDSELDAVFPGDVMSARAYVTSFLDAEVDDAALMRHWGPLTHLLLDRARQQPHGIIVDPISGRHLQVLETGANFRYTYLAFLDAACELNAFDRAQVVISNVVLIQFYLSVSIILLLGLTDVVWSCVVCSLTHSGIREPSHWRSRC